MKISILFLALLAFLASCKIEGCTDPEFSNYNPQASVDDGSCKVKSSITNCYGINYIWSNLTEFDSIGQYYVKFHTTNNEEYLLLEFNEKPSTGEYFSESHVDETNRINSVEYYYDMETFYEQEDYYSIDVVEIENGYAVSICGLYMQGDWNGYLNLSSNNIIE